MDLFPTQDSLLATPLILDLTELLTRVKYRKSEAKEFAPLYPVLSLLSYMLKAPLVKPGQSFTFYNHGTCLLDR